VLTFVALDLLSLSRYDPENSVPTKEGNIYAFGSVVLQVAALSRRIVVGCAFLEICRMLGPHGRATI